MFFEAQNSIRESLFGTHYMTNIQFPLHLQRSFEYAEQISGTSEVIVNHQKYILEPGDAVLIFPLQPHSYSALTDGRLRVCIFSPDFVSEFYKSIQNKHPDSNTFKCSLPQNIPLDTVYHKKALSYFICGEFDKDRKYSDISTKNEHQILTKLLLFADENHHSKCLLRDAAASIGYDYAYISKLFKRKVGISFREYINNLRIIESKQLLRNDAKSIEEIAEICGFSSLRAFDREFLKQVGTTPSGYQKRL